MNVSLRWSPQGSRRCLGAFAVVLLILVTALLVDGRVAAWTVHFRGPLLDTLIGVVNPIGSGVTLLLLCMTMGVVARPFGRSRLQGAAWVGTLAFVLSGLAEFGLKLLVGRPRPDAAVPGIVLLGPTVTPDFDSFPSGHATSVFAVATVFAAFYPRLSWPLYGLAAAVALGRVYLERHYVSDIFAGAVIGTVIASYLLRHPIVLSRWSISGPDPNPVH